MISILVKNNLKILIMKNSIKNKKRGNFKPKGRQVSCEAQEEIRSLLGTSKLDRSMLIEYFHKIQDNYNCLSHLHLSALAEEMRLPLSEVWEVASFYDHFDIIKENDIKPKEKTIRVCNSLTCYLNGSDSLFQNLEKNLDKNKIRVLNAPCLGACDKAPVAANGHSLIPKADLKKVNESLSGNFLYNTSFNLINLEKYLEKGGYKVFKGFYNGEINQEQVLEEINLSGLRGLGGAGFPTGKKWSLVRNEIGEKYLAVNGDEGEPGTFKDRYYLERDPHRFLEGMLIAAFFIGTKNCYIYLRDEYPEIRKILTDEIEKLNNQNINLGINIFLRRGAGAYICGEESAMIESIEGKRGLPRHRPPYVAQKGLFNKPTLVNNIETLYWVRDIIEFGGNNFSNKGKKNHPGFRSYSVSGRVNKPGVIVAPAGSTVLELIDKCGGILEGHKFKAYLPGGASGGILPSTLSNIPLDFGGELAKLGCFVGSHAIVILSDKDNIADAAKNLLYFFNHESCGQCTPCRSGTEKAIKLMKNNNWDEHLLLELAEVMSNASICGLGQAAPNPFLSTIKYFPEEAGIKG